MAAVIEDIITEMGHSPVGIAADRRSALRLGSKADIALVDLNLRDGPTGKDIGRHLADNGVAVLYMTANPAQLGDGVPGTLGVLAKPVMDDELKQAVNFLVASRRHRTCMRPARLTLFDQQHA